MMLTRARWKRIAVLAAVLVSGVTAVSLFLIKAQERKPFLGKVDLATGLRCRFTLSPDWRRKANAAGQFYAEAVTFTSPPSAIRQWLATHVYHQQASKRNPPTIYLMSANVKDLRFNLQIQAGYPELPTRNSAQLHVFVHRHLLIDGYPATVLTASDRSDSGTLLLVYVPEHSMAYILIGAGQPPSSARIEREMQAITASFHIDKVAVPTVGKR